MRWYEVDPTWLVIKILAVLGLARDVKIPTPAMQERLKKVA
jgi:fatty-acid desaturase